MEEIMKKMESRRIALVIRWPLFATIMVALFWTIYWLATGTIPSADKVQLTDGLAIASPFSIPRIFDALFVGVSVAIFIILLTSRTLRESNEFGLSLAGVIIVGPVMGGMVALMVELISGHCAMGLIIGMLIAGLLGFVFSTMSVRPIVALVVGLIIGLFCGVLSILFGGSVFGLTFELIFALVCIVISAILFASRRIGRFLMAGYK